MKKKNGAKTAVLLLSFVVMLGFTKCANADNFYRHHYYHPNSILGFTNSLREFKNQRYYSCKMAMKDYYREQRSLAMREKFIAEQRSLARYEQGILHYPDIRYVDYYRYRY